MSKTALFLLMLLLVAGGSAMVLFASRLNDAPATGSSRQPRELPAEPLESFQLTAQTGETFDSETLRGKVWIASFFFASCPATCRDQNRAIAELQEKFGERGVKFLSISVDPAADDPHTLNVYSQGFKADPQQWYFLTDREQTIDYTRRIGVDIFKVPVTTQGHADTLILVDRQGAIHDYYNWKKPDRVAQLHSDIETLLEAPATPAAGDASEGGETAGAGASSGQAPAGSVDE